MNDITLEWECNLVIFHIIVIRLRIDRKNQSMLDLPI